MNIKILAPALALAALSLAACGPKTDAGNNTATETLTLNEEGDAGLANSEDFTAGNDLTVDNGTTALGDNALTPTDGNAL